MASYEPQCTGIKICKTCNRELPVLFFSVSRNYKDGLSPNCRECCQKVSAANYSRKKTHNLEKAVDLYNLTFKKQTGYKRHKGMV